MKGPAPVQGAEGSTTVTLPSSTLSTYAALLAGGPGNPDTQLHSWVLVVAALLVAVKAQPEAASTAFRFCGRELNAGTCRLQALTVHGAGLAPQYLFFHQPWV